jgi:hypothetical protein
MLCVTEDTLPGIEMTFNQIFSESMVILKSGRWCSEETRKYLF